MRGGLVNKILNVYQNGWIPIENSISGWSLVPCPLQALWVPPSGGSSPLTSPFTDPRAQWLTEPNPNAEELFRMVGEIFIYWSKSHVSPCRCLCPLHEQRSCCPQVASLLHPADPQHCLPSRTSSVKSRTLWSRMRSTTCPF